MPKKKTQTQHDTTQTMITRLKEGLLIIVGTFALFLLVSLATYHPTDPGWSSVHDHIAIQNAVGIWGAWFADFLISLFGFFAYVVPFLIVYGVWVIYCERQLYSEKKSLMFSFRLIGGLLTILCGSGLSDVLLAKLGQILPQSAGGIIGHVLVYELYPILHFYGTAMMLIAGFLTGLTLFAGVSWFKLILRCCWLLKKIGWFALIGLSWIGQSIRYLMTHLIRFLQRCWHHKRQTKADKQSPYLSEPETDAVVAPPKKSTSKPKQITTVAASSQSAPRKEVMAFQGALPSVKILDKPTPSKNKISKSDLQSMSALVEEKLADFGVQANVVGALPGPVVTRYELQLAPGMKVSKLSNLSKDLARSLSAISVRVVEVIPGKSVVGIELPNENREMVRLKEVLDTDAFRGANSPVTMGLGKDISGLPVQADLGKMPHLLVAGTTGSGKSVGVNAMIVSMLLKATPDQLRLIMIDPKMLELSVYEGIPHLLTPVVTDMKEAASALRWCVKEMDRRYQVMSKLGVRNLAGLNEKLQQAKEKGDPILDPMYEPIDPDLPVPELESMPYIVVIVDEFADMMMVVGKKVEELIARIAQKARAAGIHLILATQRPSVDVITGLIKANIPSRIAFQVSSKIDSRTILDQMGADQLLGHGDMLYLAPGTSVPVRVHGAFVDDDEVHRVVKAWSENGEPDYIDAITNTSEEGEGGDSPVGESDAEKDPFYDDAVQIVIDSQRASISSVQRRLKIGYNRAARLIEQMEAAGIVSEMQNNGMREVLVPKR